MEQSIKDIPSSKEGKMNISRLDWKKAGIAIGIAVLAAAIIFILISGGKSASALKSGDSADIEYTMLIDGKEIASNISRFSVGSIGEGFGLLSDKADKAAIGLNKSSSITVNFSPSEAYGEYDPSKLSIINRTQSIKRIEEINRTFTVSLASFEGNFDEKPVLNKIYSPEGAPWSYKVIALDNSSVKLSQEVSEGKIIPISTIMFAKVIKVTSDRITTQLNLNSENSTLQIPTGNLTLYSDKDYLHFRLTPPVGEVIPLNNALAKVISFNETSIVVDYNNPYAGKNVTLVLKVISIFESRKAVLGSDASDIKGAPTLQVFVMSYCPYGIQMEKGVLPAYELLKGKANFKIRFVSYTMHGQQEEDENSRQICLREETKQFWQYLSCFTDKGDASACMKEAGVGEDKMNDCMANRAKDYMAADKELNEKYGVGGSPMNILNENEVQIYPRSPEDVKKAVCDAFTSKPSECNTKLDTSNPSPGFGSGTSSSGSASCGA